MPDAITPSSPDFENQLQKERQMRMAAEADARKWKSELVALENEMAKAQQLRERVDRYKYKLSQAKKQKSIYGGICVVLVLITAFFAFERFQKDRELNTLRTEFQQKGAPKKELPGIITQEALERDAARQGAGGDEEE